MRTKRLLAMAMVSLAAVTASATSAAAQGAKAHVRIEVVQPAIPMRAVQRVIARAMVDSVSPASRTLPAGACLSKHDRTEVVSSRSAMPAQPKRSRTVRVITLAYAAN